MIDLHCHFLPIDDGAKNMGEALDLARMAVKNGITHSVLTPHIHPGRYENEIYSIAAAFNHYKRALEVSEIPLRIAMGAEMRISIEMVAMLEKGLIPFLGEKDGYKVLLLEFPHSHILPGTDKIINLLLRKNIRPLIAHPERNKDVIRNFDKIVPFVDQGCLLQVTSGAVAGRFGDNAQKRAIQLLEHDFVEVLASDSHDLVHRFPDLTEGSQAAAEIIGEEAAKRLVVENPWNIVKGQFTSQAAQN